MFKSTNNTENLENFLFDIKSMSTLLHNWCLTDAEINDATLFLAIQIKKRIEEFESSLPPLVFNNDNI